MKVDGLPGAVKYSMIEVVKFSVDEPPSDWVSVSPWSPASLVKPDKSGDAL